MFTTGDWIPRSITSSTSNDLLVCLRKDDQFIVVYAEVQVLCSRKTRIIRSVNLCAKKETIPELYHRKCQWRYHCFWLEEKKPIIVVDRLGIYRYSYMYLGIDSNFNVSSTACDSVVHIIVTYFGGDKIHMLDRQGISEEHHARGRNTNTMRCVYPWSRWDNGGRVFDRYC